MNISIIVGGRFHAFNLAEQLNNNNNLKQLITTYPKYFIKKNYGIDKKKIRSVILKEIVERSFLGKIYDFNDKLIEHFDKKAQKLIDFENLDILIGWSSFSLQSFLKAQSEKCIKILERGSTHIEFQNQVLKDEYKIQDIKFKQISKYIMEKENKEYELADYIMVPTDFVKKTFIDKGFPKEKIIKNPYGVNLNQFKPNKTKEYFNKVFRIIYTGTVSVRKGILYLLETFEELNIKNSELLIIGNTDKELNKKLKKYKNNENIKFKNAIDQSSLKDFYNISDIFVTCSVEEGLSMVQLQAMSCGLPVVCTTHSGGQEVIDQGVNGYILPIRDKEKLKEKILYLYENKSFRIEMGENAKKTDNFQENKDISRSSWSVLIFGTRSTT